MKNRQASFHFLALFAFFLCPLMAFAQPFSQLDFDRGFKSKPTKALSTSERIKELSQKGNLTEEEKIMLEELRLLMGEEATAVTGKTTALLTLNQTTVNFSEELSFIPPALKGPQVDPGDKGLISSQVHWVPKSRSCLDFVSIDEVCKKAKALDEVITRFTGEKDFFEGTCAATCPSGEESVMTDLILSSNSQAEMRTAARGTECRVTLGLTGPRWLLIYAKSAVCSCLPKSCME